MFSNGLLEWLESVRTWPRELNVLELRTDLRKLARQNSADRQIEFRRCSRFDPLEVCRAGYLMHVWHCRCVRIFQSLAGGLRFPQAIGKIFPKLFHLGLRYVDDVGLVGIS